jgi:hypothetical protein
MLSLLVEQQNTHFNASMDTRLSIRVEKLHRCHLHLSFWTAIPLGVRTKKLLSRGATFHERT